MLTYANVLQENGIVASRAEGLDANIVTDGVRLHFLVHGKEVSVDVLAEEGTLVAACVPQGAFGVSRVLDSLGGLPDKVRE